MSQSIDELEVTLKKQNQVLTALVTALLIQSTKLHPEQEVLEQLAIDRHLDGGHKCEFVSCKDEVCEKVVKFMARRKPEITFSIDELDRLKQYQLHYGSRLAGTITAFLTEKSSLIVVQ